MPKYTINGKTYSSPTPLSDDDLMELAGESPAQPQAQPKAAEPTFLDKLGRSSALAGRSLLEGAESAVTFPVRAVAEAARGGLNLAGFNNAAEFIKPLGMSGNGVSAVMDYAGAPKPETGVEKTFAGANRMLGGVAAAGAPTIVSNVSRMLGGVPATVAPVLGTTAAPTFSNAVKQAAMTPEGRKEVLSNLIPTATSGGQLALAAGIGGAMEAAPEATLATVGGLAALKGGKMALGAIDDKLTAREVAKLDPTQSEIIRDLGILKGQNPKGALNAAKLNTLGSSYVDEAVMKLEQTGLMTPELKFAVDNRQVLATKPGLLANLRTSPEGEALYQAMSKDAALGMMTAREPALGGLFKLGRSAVDAGAIDAITGFPLPRSFRDGAKSVMGPATERYQQAEKWVSPRKQKAAGIVLAENGPSDATKGLGILQQTADDRLAADIANGREAIVAKRTVLEEAQLAKEAKAAEAAAKQAEKEAIREGGTILKERKAAESAKTVKPAADPNLSISELQATDPTYLLGLSNPNGVPRNARQMQEFSDVMRAQMEAPVKAQAKANAGILDQVSQEAGVVNRSGPLQTLDAGFGLDEAGMDKVLTDLLAKRPALKPVIESLYQTGASLSDNGLLKLSDIIKKEAGLKFTKPQPQGTPGMLSQAPGRLSEGSSNVSRTIYNLSDDQVTALLGRDSDTLGNGIDSAKAYLTTRASRAMKTLQESGSVPEADMALLKQLGLI